MRKFFLFMLTLCSFKVFSENNNDYFQLNTFSGQPITHITLSEQKNFLLTGDEQGYIFKYEMESRGLRRMLKPFDEAVASVFYDEESSILLALSFDGAMYFRKHDKPKMIKLPDNKSKTFSNIFRFRNYYFFYASNTIYWANKDGQLDYYQTGEEILAAAPFNRRHLMLAKKGELKRFQPFKGRKIRPREITHQVNDIALYQKSNRNMYVIFEKEKICHIRRNRLAINFCNEINQTLFPDRHFQDWLSPDAEKIKTFTIEASELSNTGSITNPKNTQYQNAFINDIFFISTGNAGEIYIFQLNK